MLDFTTPRSKPLPGVSRLPALLIWGDQDQPDSDKARAQEALFTRAQKVVLPNSPHPCYLKQPQMFNAAVLQFAGALDAAMRLGEHSQITVSADW